MPRSKRQKPDAMQKLLQAGTKGDEKLVNWVFDQTICRASFAKMVIVHEYPFNCVTHHYLKAFLKDLQPEFKLMTRNTVRSDCIKIYQGEHDILYDLLENLDSRVSFTSDLWTSSSGDRGFLCLTGHYIDSDWKLRKRILAFTPLPSPHTGKNIAQSIHEKMVIWNLDKKAFSLVLDNASSNDVCIKELLKTSLKDALPVEGSIFHQRCGCHILNLIVQDGLGVLSIQIHNIREIMKYIRGSQARMERFKLAVTQAKAPNKKPNWDVATRWNSTYTMLQLALLLNGAINRFATLDTNFKFCPSEADWVNVQALTDCLKVFYDATVKLSGTNYPTLNLFFTEFCEICLVIKKMENSPLPYIVSMGRIMFSKWDKYWQSGNMILAIACVLDPRAKMTVVEYYFDLLYPASDSKAFIASLKACMLTLFNEYLEKSSKLVAEQAGTPSGDVRTPSAPTDSRAGLKEILRGKKKADLVKSELDEYLSEVLDDAGLEDSFDILAWWKLKAPRYPVLSRLTRDVLAVPMSTVASESTFSTSGRTLSQVRNSLNDESIEALICAQDWLRAAITDNGGEVGDPLWATDN